MPVMHLYHILVSADFTHIFTGDFAGTGVTKCLHTLLNSDMAYSTVVNEVVHGVEFDLKDTHKYILENIPVELWS